MPRGGPRPNSGRKSNAELARCHAQMDEVITPDDWRAIYARLVQIVKEADPNTAVKAARLLIHQRWGDGAVPQPDPDDADDVCEIKFIHVDTSAAESGAATGHPTDAADEDNSDDDTGESTGEEPAPTGSTPASSRRGTVPPASWRSLQGHKAARSPFAPARSTQRG